VDSTLIFWNTKAKPDGHYLGHPWSANQPLISGIKDFVYQYPNELVVMWSGGGMGYAREMAGKLGFGDEITYLAKGIEVFSLVRRFDVVVDDEPIFIRTHAPDEWPK
jgi:hypothetical protein